MTTGRPGSPVRKGGEDVTTPTDPVQPFREALAGLDTPTLRLRARKVNAVLCGPKTTRHDLIEVIAFADYLAAQQQTETIAFTPPPGGLMTVEVGTITGLMDLWLEKDRAKVRYAGAHDIYTVAGYVPTGWSLPRVTAFLFNDPGLGADGNPLWVQLPERRTHRRHVDL